jgi:hypothetical protein
MVSLADLAELSLLLEALKLITSRALKEVF